MLAKVLKEERERERERESYSVLIKPPLKSIEVNAVMPGLALKEALVAGNLPIRSLVTR